ncbi:MAG: type II CAAX prenyl endopeptidase Rce1 family protein [Candidatus Hodarchaeota archaeon]
MSKDNQKKIKYCVYCGSNVEKNETYCPKCGKLIIKLEPGEKLVKPQVPQKLELSRKCPGCGSIITSTILNQCPLCNTELEKISESKKASIQKKPGLIFTSKKLELEQQFILKKDTWNLKEGINVFGTCIYIMVIIFFLLFTILSFQLDTLTGSIQQIILSQIPQLVFGVYPIWYIYNKKHSFNKIGFYPESKKLFLGLFIGILGAIVLILINYISDSFINFLSDLGLDFFDVKLSIENQNQIIKNADLLWLILLTITLSIGAFSAEIVFRGVLHNALKQKFKNDFYVILLVALAYSLVMLLFSFPIGVSFILGNFLMFMALGIIFELTNGNISSTIFTSVFYNIVIIILIYLYF